MCEYFLHEFYIGNWAFLNKKWHFEIVQLLFSKKFTPCHLMPFVFEQFKKVWGLHCNLNTVESYEQQKLMSQRFILLCAIGN